MDWLVAMHPSVAAEVLALIPEFTRWDYLVRHIAVENKEISECATAIVNLCKQMKEMMCLYIREHTIKTLLLGFL